MTAAGARRRLVLGLGAALLLGLAAGLATGPFGFAPGTAWNEWRDGQAGLWLWEIRAPRTAGAALVGALLGLSGALAQGLFRNALADPFLMGSAAGAGLGVVVFLAAGSLLGHSAMAHWGDGARWLERLGVAGLAFVGAVGGVALTLMLSRGALHTTRLLLSGVVVGVLLTAVGDLLTLIAPDALRGKQSFLLGSTGLLDRSSVAVLLVGVVVLLLWSLRQARVLDALTLGEDTARSLGLDLGRLRLQLVLGLSLCTALAVAQAGLIAFVGLVAPHLVRRLAPGTHLWLLSLSSAMGAALLLWADVLSRAALAPEELPVGLVTSVLGGCYLVWLLRRRMG